MVSYPQRSHLIFFPDSIFRYRLSPYRQVDSMPPHTTPLHRISTNMPCNTLAGSIFWPHLSHFELCFGLPRLGNIKFSTRSNISSTHPKYRAVRQLPSQTSPAGFVLFYLIPHQRIRVVLLWRVPLHPYDPQADSWCCQTCPCGLY